MAARIGTSPRGCVLASRGTIPMHSRFYALATAAMLAAGPGPATGDHLISIQKQDLVGAWRYETSYIEFPDGHRESQFGEHPQGLVIILPNGWYSPIIMRDD